MKPLDSDTLTAIARDPATPIRTARAAREALDAIDRVRVCLALDAGAPTHERFVGGDRVHVLGDAPPPPPAAMPSVST